MNGSHLRAPAVAGQFYPADAGELSELIDGWLSEVEAEPRRLRGAIVPHAGLAYSGRCAAEVFGRALVPPVAVIIAPNHTGQLGSPGGASTWSRGAFQTPLGSVSVAATFAEQLETRCSLVAHDPDAHRYEHAVEVELPFLAVVAPKSAIVPILLAWDDWDRCKRLADAVARLVTEWPEEVLLIASSDMTHYESARRAAEKDQIALAEIERLDGRGLLRACEREGITMCGRAPAAVVLEATRQLGATAAEVVDYRHSGWATGNDSSVVAYAGVVIP